MRSQPLKVIEHGNLGCSTRVKPSLLTLLQWHFIVYPDQLHEHARDKHHQVGRFSQFVLRRQQLDIRSGMPPLPQLRNVQF